MDCFSLIEKASSLNEEDFQKLLDLRASKLELFKQLKVGMRFLIQDGYDDFEQEIISIDRENKTFKFQDHSLINFPEKHSQLKNAKFLHIPCDLYESLEDLKKGIKFKFK